MIKVSVIVPVYGVEKYIEKCLISLVNQSLEDIEIIVVNDGSKDNSQAIIDKYRNEVPGKIHSFIKDNGGQGSARNLGIQMAKGEYISFVDSDDYIQPDMLAKMYEKAKESNADVVICDYYNVDENYNLVKIEKEKKYSNDNKINGLLASKAVWNKLYRKDLISNRVFRTNKWYEDLDFTIKTIYDAKKIEYIDEPLYNYVLRSGSTMNNSNVGRNMELLEAFNEILNYGNTDQYHDIVEFLAIDHIYISAIVRIISSNAVMKYKKECINKLLVYMNSVFPNYKKNCYVSTLSRNRKIIYELINLKLYFLVKIIFKLRRSRK